MVMMMMMMMLLPAFLNTNTAMYMACGRVCVLLSG